MRNPNEIHKVWQTKKQLEHCQYEAVILIMHGMHGHSLLKKELRDSFGALHGSPAYTRHLEWSQKPTEFSPSDFAVWIAQLKS